MADSDAIDDDNVNDGSDRQTLSVGERAGLILERLFIGYVAIMGSAIVVVAYVGVGTIAWSDGIWACISWAAIPAAALSAVTAVRAEDSGSQTLESMATWALRLSVLTFVVGAFASGLISWVVSEVGSLNSGSDSGPPSDCVPDPRDGSCL